MTPTVVPHHNCFPSIPPCCAGLLPPPFPKDLIAWIAGILREHTDSNRPGEFDGACVFCSCVLVFLCSCALVFMMWFGLPTQLQTELCVNAFPVYGCIFFLLACTTTTHTHYGSPSTLFSRRCPLDVELSEYTVEYATALLMNLSKYHRGKKPTHLYLLKRTDIFGHQMKQQDETCDETCDENM